MVRTKPRKPKSPTQAPSSRSRPPSRAKASSRGRGADAPKRAGSTTVIEATAAPSPPVLVKKNRSSEDAATTTAAKRARLSEADRALLQSVLAKAAAVHEAVESTWTDFGQWIFTQVFGEDSTAVIDHADDNPVYTELLHLADGPKVRIRREEIQRAVLCATYDKRLNNDSWRALNYGRKWRLLRIEDEKLMRKAAQHVLASNMDTRGVETYVRNILTEHGNALETRVNLRALSGQLQRVTERVSSNAFLKKLTSAAKDLDPEQRARVVAQEAAARTALEVLHKKLSAKQ